jgi:hypothetical protein
MAKHHRAVSVLRRSIYNGALCPTRNPTMAATPLNPFDLYDVRSLLSEDERAVQDAVARFTDERVIPIIGDCFDKGVFPKELISEMAELGLLGATLPTEYGCSGLNGVSYGLICQELERGDSGIRSFASVQSSLCMYPIYAYGNEEQRKRWLPDMAAGKVIGCFGLTEPQGGSDPASMKTYAKKDGADWIINGSKMWITNGNLADIAIVWALTDDGIQGFVVEKDFAGFTAQEIHKKMSLRASVTSALFFRQRARARRQPLAQREGPEGAARLPDPGPIRHHLGPDRRRHRLLQRSTGVFQEPHTVQAADCLAPGGPAQAGGHGTAHHHGAVALTAIGAPQGCRHDAAHPGLSGQVEQLPHGHRHRPRGTRHPRRRWHHHRTLSDPACLEPGIGDHLRRHGNRASTGGWSRSHRHQRVLIDTESGPACVLP